MVFFFICTRYIVPRIKIKCFSIILYVRTYVCTYAEVKKNLFFENYPEVVITSKIKPRDTSAYINTQFGISSVHSHVDGPD